MLLPAKNLEKAEINLKSMDGSHEIARAMAKPGTNSTAESGYQFYHSLMP